jgi:hypothetical protein
MDDIKKIQDKSNLIKKAKDDLLNLSNALIKKINEKNNFFSKLINEGEDKVKSVIEEINNEKNENQKDLLHQLQIMNVIYDDNLKKINKTKDFLSEIYNSNYLDISNFDEQNLNNGNIIFSNEKIKENELNKLNILNEKNCNNNKEKKNSLLMKKRNTKELFGSEIKSQINYNIILNNLKQMYPKSEYIKSLKKTFLYTRIERIMVFHQETLYKDQKLEIKKFKSTGETHLYKNNVFDIEFNSNIKIEEFFKILDRIFLDGYFKIIINELNIIFFGRTGKQLLKIIKNFFNKKEIFEKYNIKKIIFSSYEFYEELYHEIVKNHENNEIQFNFKSGINQTFIDEINEKYKDLCRVRNYLYNYCHKTEN